MTSRPSLAEGARRWLTSGQHTVMRQALTDFVEGHYRGHAAAVKAVHDVRAGLLEDPRSLAELGAATVGPWDNSTVGLASEHSAPSDQGRLLFQLVRAFQPERVIELGTNIGISAAYIATGLSANGKGRLVTLEASGLRLLLAAQVLAQLGLRPHVDLVEGYFDDTLPELLAGEPVDMAFVDGNHTEEATLRYYEMLSANSRAGTVLVFDDIRWSEGMTRAWEVLAVDSRPRLTLDLGRTGILVI